MSYLDKERAICDEMIKQAKKIYNLSLQMSNGGNISCRVPNEDLMIVKATDVGFDEISLSNLVVTDFSGNKIEGEKKPSKESLLHGAIYERYKNVGAIFHCHSPFATAYCANNDQLELSTYHASLKLFDYCPVFDTKSYIVPTEYFETIFKTIDENPKMNSFLLRGHGQVTLSDNIKSAAYLAELVEETAKIAILSKI